MYSLSRYILRPNQVIVLKVKKGKTHRAEWGKNFLYLTSKKNVYQNDLICLHKNYTKRQCYMSQPIDYNVI